MKLRRSLYGSFLCTLLLFLLWGCGGSNLFEGMSDDDTREAQLDKSLEAIDDGDYEKAVALLEPLYEGNPNNSEIKRYLASAYVGTTDFDTLELISEISEDAGNDGDDGDDGGTGDVETDKKDDLYGYIRDIFADERGYVVELQSKIATVQKAIALLLQAESSGAKMLGEATRLGSTATVEDFVGVADEHLSQAGLYAAIEMVLITIEILGDEQMIDGVPVMDINAIDLLSSAQISDKIQQFFYTVPGNPQSQLTVMGVLRIDRLNFLLHLIDTTRLTLMGDEGEGNDIAADMNELLEETGYYPDELLTVNELDRYLQTQFGGN